MNAVLALLYRLLLSSYLNILVDDWLVKVSSFLWHVLWSERCRCSKHVSFLIKHCLNEFIGATWDWYGLPSVIGVRVIIRVIVVINLLTDRLYLLLLLL